MEELSELKEAVACFLCSSERGQENDLSHTLISIADSIQRFP